MFKGAGILFLKKEDSINFISLGKRTINWEESKSNDLFSYYIRSFNWVPFDGEFSKKGAYDIISSLARLGKIEEAIESARIMGILIE
jgi:hypothetical protein